MKKAILLIAIALLAISMVSPGITLRDISPRETLNQVKTATQEGNFLAWGYAPFVRDRWVSAGAPRLAWGYYEFVRDNWVSVATVDLAWSWGWPFYGPDGTPAQWGYYPHTRDSWRSAGARG